MRLESITGNGKNGEVFTILNNIGKILYDEETVNNFLSHYMLLNFFRGNPSGITISDQFNKKSSLSVYQQYLAIFGFYKDYGLPIPSWISKDATPKISDDTKKVAIHFECKPSVAEQYMDILSKDELKELLLPYKFAKIGKNNRLESTQKK